MPDKENNIHREVILEIKRLGINGEGIGYYNKKAVFVDNALPKEKIKVEIIEDKGSYLLAKNVSIIKESDYRVKPFCKYFFECGGCQNQHIEYNKMLEYKKELLTESLFRYANIREKDVKIYPVVKMENPLNYRNKSSLPINFSKNKTRLGLYKKNTNHLVNIENCPIQDERINKLNNKICEYIDELKIKIYNSKDQKGTIKFIITRIAFFTGEIQVTFLLHKDDPLILELARKVIAEKGVISVYQDIKIKDDNFDFFSKKLKLLEGEEIITEKFNDYSFRLLPSAFFQLNSRQTKVLYELIREVLGSKKLKLIFDCYCGTGTISAYLANCADKIIGIDSNIDSIKNARLNAKNNHQENLEFLIGDCFEIVRDLIRKEKIPDCLVLDPPREGLKNFIELIDEIRPKRIIYVSCNVSTLAKDLDKLQRHYKIREIRPVDMFPFVSIVETIVSLEILAK